MYDNYAVIARIIVRTLRIICTTHDRGVTIVAAPFWITEEIADAICDRLTACLSLRKICRNKGMPSKTSVFKWLGQNATFADQHARAREAQADGLVDEMVAIHPHPTRHSRQRRKGHTSAQICGHSTSLVDRQLSLRAEYRGQHFLQFRSRRCSDALAWRSL
ncbi:hypothetical protein [Rhizobium sp. PL01]|uniref:terminase small subunit-like protein n=1 Tax=Rhizobium sp. PL01 TaxID=3085631 RepID=UPI003990E759